MATNFGGTENVDAATFPVLQLDTFVPRIEKVFLHAGATYYNMQ